MVIGMSHDKNDMCLLDNVDFLPLFFAFERSINDHYYRTVACYIQELMQVFLSTIVAATLRTSFQICHTSHNIESNAMIEMFKER